MADLLRTDTAKQLLLPNEYSELLQSVCGGHALWAPRRVDRGGGQLGDAGHIERGGFIKEFNIYEDPPEEITPLQRPNSGIIMDDQYNSPIMKSAQDCTIEFRITGTADLTTLPLSVAPLSVEPRITLQRDRVAFLAPPKPTRRDTLSKKRREESREWLTHYRRVLPDNLVVLTGVVRSSGWVGGLATGRKTEVSLSAGATIANAAGATVGTSALYHDSQISPIQGPDNWSKEDDASYTLIVNYVTARTRMQRLKQKIKQAVSSTSPSYTPPASSPSTSARPSTMHTTSEQQQHGAIEQAPLDSDMSQSYIDDEPGDFSLLADILDMVLDQNNDIDVAVADWDIIQTFIENYSSLPIPNPSVVQAQVTQRTVTSPRDKILEVVAFVDALYPASGPSVRPQKTHLTTDATIIPDDDAAPVDALTQYAIKKAAALSHLRKVYARVRSIAFFKSSHTGSCKLQMRAVADSLVSTVGHSVDDRRMGIEEGFLLLMREPRGTKYRAMLQKAIVAHIEGDGHQQALMLLRPASAFLAEEAGRSYMVLLTPPPSEHVTPSSSTHLRRPNSGSMTLHVPTLEPPPTPLPAVHTGTPYVRSVAPTRPLVSADLPNPSVIFATLFRRNEFQKHPSNISSLFFAFSTIIALSLFQTSHTDTSTNIAASSLNLSPLYGHNKEQQIQVRINDGRGILKNDTFADERLLTMSAATAALIVLFGRNHNYIAGRLLLLNERQAFQDPGELFDQPEARRQQDDAIFTQARRINCAYFMQVFLSDYVNTILGTLSGGFPHCFDSSELIRDAQRTVAQRDHDNLGSVEMNIAHRWHGPSSRDDEEWFRDHVLGQMLRGKSPDTITPSEFEAAVHEWSVQNSENAEEWEFGGLKREIDGRFKDEDLARIVQKASSAAAGALGARSVAPAMRIRELMAIESARTWGVCTLNEFREYLGLKRYETFEEWNPDPNIHVPARGLYGDIENLELYVGLQAEETKKPQPGSALAAGFTLSRAILFNAIRVVCGDRRFTTALTPADLTAWGYRESMFDPDTGSRGGQLSKLLLRTLPNQLDERSVYAHFPMITPDAVLQILTDLGLQDEYTFEREVSNAHRMTVVSRESTVRAIIHDSDKMFRTPYGQYTQDLTDGYGFYVSGIYSPHYTRDRYLVREGLFTSRQMQLYATFFKDTTFELIKEKSFAVVHNNTRMVDIVRDVVNLLPVHWVSTYVADIVLKDSRGGQRGSFTDARLYEACATMYEFVFLNRPECPEGAFGLRERAREWARKLVGDIRPRVEAERFARSTLRSVIRGLSVPFGAARKNDAQTFVRTIATAAAPVEEIVYTILGTIVANVPSLGHAAAHIINFYLQKKHTVEREHITRLASMTDVESNDLLTGYVLEALRLDPPIPGVYRECTKDVVIDQGDYDPLVLKTGDQVFVSITRANRDRAKFGSDNELVDPRRPGLRGDQDVLVVLGCDEVQVDFCVKTLPQILRAVFSHKNVRRAPGNSGRLKRVTTDWHGTPRHMYQKSNGEMTPWPQSLLIQYDL